MMQRVIAINLNGNAYQVDEEGYEALTAYLTGARERLAENPDRAEILADLEQAVADKCEGFLGRHKTVVSASEMARILEEMGPVDTEGGPPEAPEPPVSDAGESRSHETGAGSAWSTTDGPRRVYRLKDEGDQWQIEGVCAGLGAYFGVDPTIVRAVFVLLLIVSAGLAGVFYLLLVMVIPEAKTPEQRAAAYGTAFNAQEVLSQVRSKGEELKREAARFNREQRARARYWRRHYGVSAPFGIVGFVAMFLVIFFAVQLLVAPVGWLNRPFGPMRMIGPWWLGPGPHFWASLLALTAVAVLILALRGRRGGPPRLGHFALVAALALTIMLLIFA